MLGIYEVDKTGSGTVTQTRTYYPAAGAMRIDSTLYYILKDHLGSASVITNASGVTVSGGEQRYYPYGEGRLTATMITDKLFTGQREMAGLGIYHYGARFYSPKLGRFLSADTIVPSATNPQAYNRYSYVLGNPLKYTDPTGHYCVGDDEDCADEGGNGPAPTGNSGGSNNNGNNGNPHDDDDLDPNPNSFISTIGLAISYLQYSPLGQSLYDYMIAQGFTVVYSTDGSGHLNGTYIEVPHASPASIAGTIAHEAAHQVLSGDGTLLQEYQAYLVGDIVRNDLIQAGHGNSSDMKRPLSNYTVNLNNPNRLQLSNDLKSWFRANRLGAYIDRWHLPALPRRPYRYDR